MADEIKEPIVFGHKNPDTDTTCSAIVFADLIGGTAVRLGELNAETEFALKKFGAKAPALFSGSVEGRRVYLVDHNEATQSADGIDNARLVGIIDHHKFNLKTAEPLFVHAEPLGSTASIVYKKYVEQGKSLTKQQAGLLLCAILSDTVVFRSSTTTQEDREIASELAEIAEIEDMDAFGIELKRKKASLAGASLEKAITSDFKTFSMGPGTLGAGQIEVVDDSEVDARGEEILAALSKLKADGKHHTTVLMATNIIKCASRLFVVSDRPQAVEAAFGKKLDNGTIYLPGAMSRKKDVIPQLERAFRAR